MQRAPAGVAQQAEQPSCKRQVSGSNPLTGSQVRMAMDPLRVSVRGTSVAGQGCLAALLLPSRTVAVESICIPRVAVRRGCRINVDQAERLDQLPTRNSLLPTDAEETVSCPVTARTTRY
jgi:hypothetical protein